MEKNYITVFLLFYYYLPSKKGRALHLNKPESKSPKDALCQFWLKLAQDSGSVVLEKKTNTWKVYYNIDNNYDEQDKLWSEKLTWTFGSGEQYT